VTGFKNGATKWFEAKRLNEAIRRSPDGKPGWIRKTLLSAAAGDKPAS